MLWSTVPVSLFRTCYISLVGIDGDLSFGCSCWISIIMLQYITLSHSESINKSLLKLLMYLTPRNSTSSLRCSVSPCFLPTFGKSLPKHCPWMPSVQNLRRERKFVWSGPSDFQTDDLPHHVTHRFHHVISWSTSSLSSWSSSSSTRLE